MNKRKKDSEEDEEIEGDVEEGPDEEIEGDIEEDGGNSSDGE